MLKKQKDGYYEIFHEQHLCKLFYSILILDIIVYRISKIVKSNPFRIGCFSTQDEM